MGMPPSKSVFVPDSSRLLTVAAVRGAAGLLAGIVLFGAALAEGDLRVVVKDQRGRPVEGAVVWVEAGARKPAPVQAEISQKDRRFHPEMTIIPAGSTVRFPNRDNVQHHVYSFSPAKTFDIPLYIGEAPQPIRFDRAGVVTLGCNIHDWMAAYIVVLDTPFYARSGADGLAVLRNVPSGATSMIVWHPRLLGKPVEAKPDAREVRLTLRPAFHRTPPDSGRDGGTGSYP